MCVRLAAQPGGAGPGQRHILFVNPDWFLENEWFKSFLSVPGVELVAKSSQSRVLLEALLARMMLTRSPLLHQLQFSIPNPVVRERLPPSSAVASRPITFAMFAGNGGHKNRRGIDIAVIAWLLALRRLAVSPCRAQLFLHAFDDPCQYLNTELCQRLQQPSSCIRVETGAVARAQMGSWLRSADAVLYPSRWEGLGLSMLEALHAGVPVLATNGTPMWDAVVHGHNGLLIAAERVEDFNLSPHYEVNPQALADAIVLLVTDRALLQRITAPQPGQLLARQHSFVLRLQELVCQRVMSFSSAHVASLYAGPHPLFRRAELFRSDALRQHGFIVDDVAIPEMIAAHSDPADLLGHVAAYDITVLSKPSPELCKLIGCSPSPAPGAPKCINWFWDPLDFTPSVRAWFESIAPLHAAVFINEKGREAMWSSKLHVPVHFIGEGTMAVAPGAAAGRRPPLRNNPHSSAGSKPANASAVFLGTLIPEEADIPRASLLNHLMKVPGLNLKLYGPEEGWALAGMTSLGPRYGSGAYEAMAAGDIVLSLSRAQPNVTMYRSERLTDAAGASACVLSEVFPGLEWMYPPHAVARLPLSPWGSWAIKVEQLLRSGDCGRMGSAAADITWRYFTWEDSVAKVLALLRCRMPPLPTNCSLHEGAPVAAADVPCWLKFSQYHRAVGLALLSAAHAREAAHHFATSGLALARASALSAPAGWGALREMALLMAACSAIVPQLPLPVDRLMQFANRLGVSPSHPLPLLKSRLCEPIRPAPKAHMKPLFSPFVAAAAAPQDPSAKEEQWTAFIEGAGLDAAVALLASANSGTKLFRMQQLVAWIHRNGIVAPASL